MTKRESQAAEYRAEQDRVAAARSVEASIARRWRDLPLPERLERAAEFALMDAARQTVLEAAEEIRRLRRAT